LNEWIALEDLKPPEHKWILGSDGYRWESGVYFDEKFHLPDQNYKVFKITHWMRIDLPDMPKKLEKSDKRSKCVESFGMLKMALDTL